MKKTLPCTSFIRRATLLAILLTSFHFVSRAQDCGCDFVINPPDSPTTSVFIDGDVLGVNPGQTICLTAGLYKQIRFIRIAGEPGNPVTIKNCGGLVQIGDEVNYGRWYATDIVRCEYIRFTGSGDPAYKYGIKLGKSGDSGLKIGLSTNNEIDHLEIGHANFAGILAKTDYGGNPPPDAPEMNNLNIHDNYIHDVLGEGMYIGETKSPGENMRHLEVWNNTVTRSGRESIQVANAVEDIQVHHNVFYASGTLNLLYQNKGFQIGDNSVGRYYNNFLIGSPSNAMIVMGSGNIEITNNYIANANDPGFFIDNRPFTMPGTPINIHNNFIMEVNESFPFFMVYNEINDINITENHLEGNNALLTYGSGAGPNVTESGNIIGAIERVQFTDAPNDNFALTAGSPYQDLGVQADVSGRNIRPYIALIPNITLDFGSTLEVPVSATDPDGDALTLDAFNLPSFVSFKDNGGGTGVFSLAPQAGDAGVYYKVRVRVTDNDGSMNSQYFHITVLDPYATQNFFASDDLFVDGKKIVDNQSLEVKEPKAISYLRFEVSGLNVAESPVVASTLKLTAQDDGTGSLIVYLGDDRTWDESNATESDLPRLLRALDTLTTDFLVGGEYELDVRSAIRENGVYNFVLVSESTRGGLQFSSSEGPFQPELSIVTERADASTLVEAASAEGVMLSDDNGRESGDPVAVFPNPAMDKITVDLGGEQSTLVSIEIADKVGKPFFQKRWVQASQLIEIDLNNLNIEPGMYFLKVKQDGRDLEILRMFKR